MLDSMSGAEKVGWLGLIGGTIVALGRVTRFVYHFSEEHNTLIAHLKKAQPLLEEIIVVREATRIAAIERENILDELQAMRREITEVLRLMVKSSAS